MIVCLGTSPTLQRTMLFKGVEAGSVNRASEVHEYASGKSVNVAKVLRTLGNDVVATGFLGGPRGAKLRHHLDLSGITSAFVDTNVETRLCTTVIDCSTGAVTELVENASLIEPDAWQSLIKRLEELLPRACTWVFSGSLAPGGPEDFYTGFLARLRGKNPQVIIDARGAPLREALRQPGVIAKCNLEEFEDTVGSRLINESELRGAMQHAAPHGGALVITLGRNGAIAYETGKFLRVRVPPVPVVSAVGSGDAFSAGLASGRQRPDKIDPIHALKLAAACGAANAMTPDSGWVRPSDLGEILPKVIVEEL